MVAHIGVLALCPFSRDIASFQLVLRDRLFSYAVTQIGLYMVIDRSAEIAIDCRRAVENIDQLQSDLECGGE